MIRSFWTSKARTINNPGQKLKPRPQAYKDMWSVRARFPSAFLSFRGYIKVPWACKEKKVRAEVSLEAGESLGRNPVAQSLEVLYLSRGRTVEKKRPCGWELLNFPSDTQGHGRVGGALWEGRRSNWVLFGRGVMTVITTVWPSETKWEEVVSVNAMETMTEDQATSQLISLYLLILSPEKGKECVYRWVLGRGTLKLTDIAQIW